MTRVSHLVLMLVLVVSAACKKVKVSEVEVIKSKNMQGVLTGDIQLNDNVSLKLNPEHDEEVFRFSTVKTGKVELKLNFASDVEFPGMDSTDVQVAKINIDFKPKDEENFSAKLDDKVEINGFKFKGLDCSNIVKVRRQGTKVTVNIKKFKSLASCNGDAYKTTKIGDRELNPKRVKSLTGLFKFKANYFSEEDDERLGREFVDNYIAENRHLILDEAHPTSTYVRELIEDIVEVSDRPDIEPKVYVINANILNAFALPGGYVFVFRGLIDASENEAALAGVLGHEWAHVTARHGTEGMTRAIRTIGQKVGIIALAEILTYDSDDSDGDVAKKRLLKDLGYMAFDVTSSLFMLGRGRDQELEADRLGTQYITKLGLAPWGLADMFRTFSQRAPNSGSSLEALLSTHPQHNERISRIYAYSQLFSPPADLEEFEIPLDSDYSYAKRELAKLSVPSKSESDSIGMSFNEAVQAFTVEKTGLNFDKAENDEEDEEDQG